MSHKHIEWKSEYTLGIEDIDYQHHYFLNLINRLSDELLSSDDPDYQKNLIAELNAYATFHFISEENMMRRVNYSKIHDHKEQHLRLLQDLVPKEAMFEMYQSKKELEDFINFLVHWFVHHTAGEDRLFADFLHEKGKL